MAIFENLLQRYPQLSVCLDVIERATDILEKAFRDQKKLLIAGNGGSAADAGHISAELLKSFRKKRALPQSIVEHLSSETAAQLEGALPAISLPDFISFQTAYANDRSAEYGFAQLVLAFGQPGDVFLALSTSGNSKNILRAIEVAHAKSLTVIGLTGRFGGKMLAPCDLCICAPEEETYKIQELHLPIYHAICQELELRIFNE